MAKDYKDDIKIILDEHVEQWIDDRSLIRRGHQDVADRHREYVRNVQDELDDKYARAQAFDDLYTLFDRGDRDVSLADFQEAIGRYGIGDSHA